MENVTDGDMNVVQTRPADQVGSSFALVKHAAVASTPLTGP